jgi:hypothetical protein
MNNTIHLYMAVSRLFINLIYRPLRHKMQKQIANSTLDAPKVQQMTNSTPNAQKVIGAIHEGGMGEAWAGHS